MNIENEILKLIDSKREGDYWDFKQCWHENKASLLHDILCLSNSIIQRKKFILIGIKDPEANLEVVGTENDPNRRSLSELLDFISNKKFAGDIRPEIDLVTITIQDKPIDIICIEDISFKPYYLAQEYKERQKIVRANHIYTRIKNKNTAINESADIYLIEKMWAQRFGLHLSPIEKMREFLKQPEYWYKDLGNKNYMYHSGQPEYTIEKTESEAFEEPYCLYYPNPLAYLSMASFKYHATTLFELELMSCDEMRIYLPVPDIGSVNMEKEKVFYFYYKLNTDKGLFLRFLTDNTLDISSRGGSGPFVIYEDENEKEEFESFITKSPNKINDMDVRLSDYELDLERPGVIDRVLIGKISDYHKIWERP